MEPKKFTANIPVQGSLGLLALGHTGVLAWRKAREAAEKSKTGEAPKSEK